MTGSSPTYCSTLEACARELHTIAQSCAKIEDALGHAAFDKTAPSSELVVELQELDRVRQVLNDLSPLLRGLARGGCDICQLLDRIRLADLRRRISHQTGIAPPKTSAPSLPSDKTGSVDWF